MSYFKEYKVPTKDETMTTQGCFPKYNNRDDAQIPQITKYPNLGFDGNLDHDGDNAKGRDDFTFEQ